MPYRDASQLCPRCRRSLESSRFITGHDVLGCPDCGGSLIDDSVLGEIARRFLDNPVVEVPGDWDDPTQRRPGEPLACPVCRGPLDPQTVFGAEVDRCAAHGMWLDLGELQQILTNADSAEVRCPRCKTAMEMGDDNGVELAACGACGGRWLTHRAAEALLKRRVVAPAGKGSVWFSSDLCPRCGDRLKSAVIAGQTLHVCAHHGAFLPP